MNFLDATLLVVGMCSAGHFLWSIKQVLECKRNDTFHDLSLSKELQFYLLSLFVCYIGIVHYIEPGTLKQGFMAITLAAAYAISPISRQQRFSNFLSGFTCYFIVFHYFSIGL